MKVLTVYAHHDPHSFCHGVLERAYDDGIRDAIGKVIDDWGFRFPGIQDVAHIYFCAASTGSPELIKQYLQQAYQPGRDFGRPADGPGHPAPAA